MRHKQTDEQDEEQQRLAAERFAGLRRIHLAQVKKLRRAVTVPVIRNGWPYRWQDPLSAFERRDGGGNWPEWAEHFSHQRLGGGKGSGSGTRPIVIYRAEPYLGIPLTGIGYLRSLGWSVTVSKERSTYMPGSTQLVEMIPPPRMPGVGKKKFWRTR